MWLSLNIISKMVDISEISPEELANKITMSTAEIDSIDYVNQHFKTIYTAKAVKVEKHPDADKLTKCTIDTGSELLSVVCGAPNHKEGDIVALAKVGTKFSEEFEIKKSKIRGVESEGMLCSEKELGLSDEHSGIMILSPETKLGISFSEIYKDWMDVRFEIDNKSITHRPDLWSHVGFAREIGALIGKPVKYPVNFDLEKNFGKDTSSIKVKIECPEEAPRYTGLVIKNIKIQESPEWLKGAVSSIGMRPINNIVDITNYVMAEIGEPMHAFDLKKLKGGEITVRLAKTGEKLRTLDEQDHTLMHEDIVISDKESAIALAGVMGGGNSEIEDSTTEIVLEAANFNPVNIRKTAQRYNLRTEAAIRFEKSLTPELTTHAILRCYELIKLTNPDAEAVSPIIDSYPVKQERKYIDITTNYIRQRIGADISDERIIQIIESLDFKIEKQGTNLHIEIPYYRSTKDVSINADIVEEVGRIYGYDNITPIAPLIQCFPPEKNEQRLFERRVKRILTMNYGMFEVSGYSFVGEEILNKLEINEDKELRLKNPLSQEQDRLRRNLMPNIISNISHNQKYKENFSLYEIGRVYLKDDRKSKDLISEKFMLNGGLYKKETDEPIFYQAKFIAKELLENLRVRSYKLQPEQKNLPPYAHPGRSLKIIIQGQPAGIISELHPETKKNFNIIGNAAFFEIDMDLLFSTKKHEIKFEQLQKFPEVPFELSVLTDKSVYAEEITSIIQKTNKKNIKDIKILSIYEGDRIPENKKSVSIKLTFFAKDRTLSSEEISTFQEKIISTLAKKGFNLR